MDTFILYGLVVLFLLAFPLFIFLLVLKPEVAAQAQQNSTHTTHVDRVSYGLVVAVFVFFSVLTFLVRRGKS